MARFYVSLVEFVLTARVACNVLLLLFAVVDAGPCIIPQ